MLKYQIGKLEKTCTSCPAQWEGTLINGREIYIRYRFGALTVQVATDDEPDAISVAPIYAEVVGKPLAGSMELDQLKELTKSFLDFPC